MSDEMTVEETLQEIATRILRKEDVKFSPTTTFKDLGADSLDIVQILVALEETFDIELPDKELKELNNTGDFLDYVKRKVAEKG